MTGSPPPDSSGAPVQSENRAVRRFHAYHVGIAKTGTTSLAGIFNRYRSEHEFMFPETAEILAEYDRGGITHAELRRFVHQRDRQGQLEMDSASFNCRYVDVLVEDFPEAKFIFIIRDYYSWLDSMLNMVHRLAFQSPMWLMAHMRGIVGDGFTPAIALSWDMLLERLPAMVEAGLQYWATTNRRVLQTIPPDRTLTMRIDDLSDSLDRLAAFVGVPRHTLLPEESWWHRGENKADLLGHVNPDHLHRLARRYGADLLDAFFPDETVSERNNAPAGR